MKSAILTSFIILLFIAKINAANIHIHSIQTDSVTQSSLGKLLDLYYGIKNALVNSDAAAAAAKADEFVNAINGIELKTLSESEHKAFVPVQNKLSADAKDISQSKDLTEQRNYFASLSDDFYSLAKGVKLSGEPIYRDYCPMKKKYWLSRESSIKNPYYGKAMLTCGSIAETLK